MAFEQTVGYQSVQQVAVSLDLTHLVPYHVTVSTMMSVTQRLEPVLGVVMLTTEMATSILGTGVALDAKLVCLTLFNTPPTHTHVHPCEIVAMNTTFFHGWFFKGHDICESNDFSTRSTFNVILSP